MKDSPILHKFNKKLLFIVGLLILLALFAVVLKNVTDDKGKSVGQNNGNAQNQAEADKTAEENIQIPPGGSNQIVPVRAIDKDDHLWGNIDAPVKMIVYDDFECPFCAEFYDTIKQVKKEFGDKVAVAFRHYPLVTIHIYSMQAAEASECASEQGKFWQMYDKLFAANKAGNLNEASMKQAAKELELDTVKFEQCFSTKKYEGKVLTQMIEAKNFNVNGTPTTFINGEIVVGAYPFEDFIAQDGVKTEGLKNIITRYLNQ
jgi:protein-disulfide isomerase